VKSGPNQDQPGSDGIGDTPYVINEFNQDNYPLMEPWTPESYIDYINETIQDLPNEIFNRPEEDVSDIKNDLSNLLNDTRENINEGNYEFAIDKLNQSLKKHLHAK